MNAAVEKLPRLKSGEITAVQNIKNLLAIIEQKNRKINAILTVNPNAIGEAVAVDRKISAGKAGKLAGLGIAVKANISVIGLPISCASRTLENYYGTFDAEVIEKIRAEDGIIIGMANCDEFACGSSGEYSAFGPTDNPSVLGYIPGGSSSGSAAAVAAGMADLALGSETGGSIRNPASHCGIVGTKPSYGRVSRYGLVDLAMSLDQIGTFGRTVQDAALLLQVIAGKSEADPTTVDFPVPEYNRTKVDLKKLRIGIAPEFLSLCTEKRIAPLFDETIKELLKAMGTKLHTVHLRYLDLAIQTYYPLVYVELFSGTRKLDGRRYGKKIEESCGEEVLRRILGGREISRAEHYGAYYRKALVVQKRIATEFQRAFKEVDVILSPVVPALPHKLGTKITDPKVIYAYDALTIPANLAGICAASVPMGKIDNIPVGIQVMAPAFKEEWMFAVMKKIEELNR